MKRVLTMAIGLSALLGIAACSGTGTGATPSSSGAAAGTVAPSPTATPTPRPTPRPEWPFEAGFCEAAPGDPTLVVALGTSETAGWYLKKERLYSPEAAYPGLYADILCHDLGVPVTLRSYYPSQQSNQLAPLAWWIDKAASDEKMRRDLGTADVVLLWAMSSHDIVKAQYFPGACGGGWPEPLKDCLEKATADIPAETDELFRMIAGLVRDDATVLAGDAFAPPFVVSTYQDESYRDEIKAMVDPLYAVKPAAERFGFRFIDTELVFNGSDRWQMPPDDLFQADGLHLTLAGQQLVATTYAEHDGIGD